MGACAMSSPDVLPLDPQEIFNAHYYAHDCGRPYQRNEVWLAVFRRWAERIVQAIQPRSTLDAGCAYGFLVEMLRARGVAAWGVDISEYAIGQVHDSMKAYCRVGSITEPFGQRRVRAVGQVPDAGVAQRREVHPDLGGATGLQVDLHQRGRRERLDGLVVGHARLALGDHGPPVVVHRVPAHRRA